MAETSGQFPPRRKFVRRESFEEAQRISKQRHEQRQIDQARNLLSSIPEFQPNPEVIPNTSKLEQTPQERSNWLRSEYRRLIKEKDHNFGDELYWGRKITPIEQEVLDSLGFTEEEKTSIDDMGLPTMTRNALKRAGADSLRYRLVLPPPTTAGNISAWSAEEISAIRVFGVKGLEKLQEGMDKLGLAFAEYPKIK